jgi:hypothetical protein
LTAEEHKLLDDAADTVQRNAFTAKVLKALTQGPADPYASEEETRKLFISPAQMQIAKKLMGGVGGAGTLGTLAGSNGTWSNSTLASNTVSVHGSPVVTQAELQKTLADYVKAVSEREKP